MNSLGGDEKGTTMHDQLITAVSIATVLTIGQGGSALIRIVRHVWKRRPRFRY